MAGTLHGGFIGYIVDNATSITGFAFDIENRFIVSTGITIEYFKGLKADQKFFIKTTIHARTRKLCFSSIEISNAEGELCCKGSHT